MGNLEESVGLVVTASSEVSADAVKDRTSLTSEQNVW